MWRAAVAARLSPRVLATLQVKAWVAASAMQATPAQLKPRQQTQQLLGLALPLLAPEVQTARRPVRRATQQLDRFPLANEVKEVAEDTVETIARNAQHEAALETSVQEQGKMLKKLMGMVEQQRSAKKAKTAVAQAKAAAAQAASQRDAELEASVKEQGQMIKKLMGMLDKQDKASSHQAKAAPKTAAAPAKWQRSAAVPTLGSWGMAKAAGNDFGTNVVHLYGDLSTQGGHVQVKNPYSSGVAAAEVCCSKCTRAQGVRQMAGGACW